MAGHAIVCVWRRYRVMGTAQSRCGCPPNWGAGGPRPCSRICSSGLTAEEGRSYFGLSDQLRAEFVPVQNFRFEFGVPVGYYDIAEVQGVSTIFIVQASTA